MIGILHAYSRSNAGDGLLVDLSCERLDRCGVDASDVVVVALDPDSFADMPQRVGVGTARRGLAWDLVPAAGRAMGLGTATALRRPLGEIARRLQACDALMAVGGGYLRAVDPVSSLGTMLNHLPQLLAASRSPVPTVYLPQSIGPLRGPVGRAVAAGLRRVDAVCVRDQWSARELDGLRNVWRVPDLAVLELAERFAEVTPVTGEGRVGLVARRLGHAPGYEAVLQHEAGRLGDAAVWAVQTAGDRTKSDAVHYDNLGVLPGGGLPDLLAARCLSVVVSVRLHGAVMALRAGVPAIHLAYDRKGPAAFADLGLDEWCLDVRRLDAQVLRDRVERLRTDPGPYWSAIASRVDSLVERSAELDGLMRSAVAGAPVCM